MGDVIPSYYLDQVVERALAEDLDGEDVTSAATIPAGERAVARAVARTELVVSGGEVFARVFYRVDPGVRVERKIDDGTRVQAGETLWVVGDPRSRS